MYDRKEEDLVSDLIAEKWNVEVVHTPTLSSVDFLLNDYDKKLKALVEFKSRKNKRDAYSTLFISKNKLLSGLDLSKALSVPLILLVKWTNTVGWMKIKTLDGFEVKTGGRKDRGSIHDVEQMVHLPTRDFKIL